MRVQIAPFFYGWMIVGVVMLAGLLSVGIHFWGFSVFIIPMEEDLGWSRSELLAAPAIGGLIFVLLSPILGPYGDTKYGPRVVYGIGAVFLVLSLIFMRYADTVWHHYLFFGIMGGIGRYGINLPLSTIPKWFIRKRGLALAWASAGAGIGTLFVAYSIQRLIDLVGWRDAWMYLGIGSFILLLPGIFLLRTSPEEMSLMPDGDQGSKSTGNGPANLGRGEEYSYTRSAALRSKLFWLVLIATTLSAFGIMGFAPNIIPFLRSEGFSASQAAASVTAYGIVGVLMRFAWGSLSRKLAIRWVFILQVATSGLGICFLYTVSSINSMLLAMAILGIGFGGFWVVQNLIVANYFGRRHIAGILGIVQPFQQGATWGGPLLFGALFDIFGNYFWVFVASITSIIISIVFVYYARQVKANTVPYSK